MRIAEGAHASGIPYVFSCQGSTPMEMTARAMGGTPFWYQLYWSTDEDLVDSMIERAEASGAQALVVTLDTTMLGWRTQDLDLGSLPFARGQGIAQYTSDPRFMTLVRERVAAARAAAQDLGLDPRQPAQQARAAKGGVGTLLSMSRSERAALPCLEPGRADLIVAGVAIVLAYVVRFFALGQGALLLVPSALTVSFARYVPAAS